MLFAIDVGNTQTTAAVFSHQKIRASWRFPTERAQSADGFAALFLSLFALKGLETAAVDTLALAAVVPGQRRVWKELARSMGWSFIDVGDLEQTRTGDGPPVVAGISLCLDQPAEVGADRIANAVAASFLYPLPAIVVDFGTATTFDCVSEDKEYLGGAILPGVAISLDALCQLSARLPLVDLSEPPPGPVGANSIDAIKAGILHGNGALVDGMVARIGRRLKWRTPSVIATGGLAGIIAPFADTIAQVDFDLTLKGIFFLYEQTGQP